MSTDGRLVIANALPTDKTIVLTGALAEGSTIRFIEIFQGQIVWDGLAEAFELIWNPKAIRIYAWADHTQSPRRRVPVLHPRPVTSVAAAARTSIVQEFRSGTTGEEA